MEIGLYLPGLALGFGLWAGLRWPFRALVLLSGLAIIAYLALSIIAGMTGDPAQLGDNETAMARSVAPGLIAFLIGQGIGALIRAKGGGGME